MSYAPSASTSDVLYWGFASILLAPQPRRSSPDLRRPVVKPAQMANIAPLPAPRVLDPPPQLPPREQAFSGLSPAGWFTARQFIGHSGRTQCRRPGPGQGSGQAGGCKAVPQEVRMPRKKGGCGRAWGGVRQLWTGRCATTRTASPMFTRLQGREK